MSESEQDGGVFGKPAGLAAGVAQPAPDGARRGKATPPKAAKPRAKSAPGPSQPTPKRDAGDAERPPRVRRRAPSGSRAPSRRAGKPAAAGDSRTSPGPESPSAAEAAAAGVRLASRAIEPLRGGDERSSTVRFLRAFWQRAYRENITGLSAMVAYNLALALFPFALLVLFIFGKVHRRAPTSSRASSTTSRASSRPSSRHAAQRRRPDPRQLDDDRRRRRARCDLDRRLVLGRDGHRLLPHLPRRVPQLGRAEALRAGDAAGRHRCFLAASVVVPIAEGVLASGADDLPFGLDEIAGVRNAAVLVVGAADHLRDLRR